MGHEKIYLAQIDCNSKTEPGADEVYFLISGLHTNGSQTQLRIPGPGQHWDMTSDRHAGADRDGQREDSHSITNRDLTQFDIAIGEEWSGVLVVMEEDGGTSQAIQNALAGILTAAAGVATATGVAAAAAPFLLAASTVTSVLTDAGLYITNGDDFIGSFSMHVTNPTGIPQIEFKALDKITRRVDWDNGLVEFHMNGDGSDYRIIMNYEGT